MAIDPQKALGATLPAGESSWNKDQVILYHLGIGAGVPQTDARELAYTYENAKDFKVVPSFAVIPAFVQCGRAFGAPGLAGEFNPMLLLHGEQDIEVHAPIPPEATVKHQVKLVGVYDKGKAALVISQCDTTDEAGKPLFTNRMAAFLRGSGGFGGDAGPKAGNEAPQRAPDLEVESKTLPQQALLYRLSGDKNPLHADPGFAKLGGFDVPILHGLCSYGIVCKAVVDNALGGDVTKVARYQARFAGVVFPGETIVTSMWREGNQVLLAAKTKERGTPVISNAAVTLRS
jgi:acyl dehydratase